MNHTGLLLLQLSKHMHEYKAEMANVNSIKFNNAKYHIHHTRYKQTRWSIIANKILE